jgi:hypothetical protein
MVPRRILFVKCREPFMGENDKTDINVHRYKLCNSRYRTSKNNLFYI